MGVCKDPRLTYLNDFGYNVVRLPRRGIVPLGVIGKDDGSQNWLGTLDQIYGLSAQEGLAFAAGDEAPLPVVQRDELVDLEFPDEPPAAGT